MNAVTNMIDEMRINDLLDDMNGLQLWVQHECHEGDLSGFVADELESIIKDAKELIDDLRKSGIDSVKNEGIAA